MTNQELADRIRSFLLRNGRNPQVIYVTQEEYIELQWNISPISKSDQTALQGDFESEMSFHGISIKYLKPEVEIRIASMLSKEQLAIFLIDPDEKIRTIAHQALKLQGP